VPPPLSLTGRRWVIKNETPVTLDACLATLFSERNLSHKERLSDPLLFPDMRKAVERIERAIQVKETIGIFGDYDADGVTGTAILVRAIRRRGIDPVVHLPDRMKEGYGMKEASVRALAGKNVKLLLTVDTGIAAHSEIALATELGIDTIVTDHHREQGGRPPAFAVIHPGIDNFPNQHLSGAGVALMLARALEKGQAWGDIDTDIALATIGIIGDVMPLTGENRLLVIHGLKAMQRLRTGPLRDFIDSIRSSKALTSGDVAFKIVPRINAAGRMAHPTIALEAILEGGVALKKLHELNGARQELVSSLLEDLLKKVDTSRPFLCIGDARITPGIAGLIAGKMTDRFGKPALAAAISSETAVASLRSIPEIDCMECLVDPSVRPFLSTFGGHAQAAGCTFRATDLSQLHEALDRIVSRAVDPALLMPTRTIDAILANAPTVSFAGQIEALAPFGQGNEEPLFLSRQQHLDKIRSVGAEKAHLQCTVGGIKAVGFHLGSLLTSLSPDQPYDCVYIISKDTWNGRETVQLVIEDLRPSS